MNWGFYLLLAALGACVGSFASNLGLRLAARRGWAAGRSQCDGCARPLGYAETVPLAGYFRAKGRCAACGCMIDPVQPSSEILGALLLPASVALAPAPAAVLIFLLGMCLLAASVTDLKAQRLPDGLMAMVAALCAGLAALDGWDQLAAGIVTAAITASVALCLRAFAVRRGGDPGLGLGDVKLASGLALWLGAGMAWAIAVAAAAGLILMLARPPHDGRLPFGPFIAAACFGLGLIEVARGLVA